MLVEFGSNLVIPPFRIVHVPLVVSVSSHPHPYSPPAPPTTNPASGVAVPHTMLLRCSVRRAEMEGWMTAAQDSAHACHQPCSV